MPGLRRGPLRRRAFRLLFAARAVSGLGSAMAPVALAFAVLDLTGSKTDLGLVLAARQVPVVLFLLFGGVWSDRLPRHLVMVGSNVVSCASQAAAAALLLAGHPEVWQLAALAALNGMSSAFFFPASSGVIPQTVTPDLLGQANALLRLGLNATTIAGSALGGIAVAVTSPGWAIAFDAVTYAASAALVAGMALPAAARAARTSVLADLREGWREFRGRTWLWAIVLQFSIVNAVGSGTFLVLGPVVAREQLGGAGAWGFILALESIGLVAGGLLMVRFQPHRILLVATWCVFGFAPPLLALAVAAPTPVVAATTFASGVAIEIFGVLWDTAMQQEIPQEKLSRVYSYDALGSWVLMPLGIAAAGPLADAFGVRDTLIASAAVVVGATAVVFVSRDVRTLQRRTAAPFAEPVLTES